MSKFFLLNVVLLYWLHGGDVMRFNYKFFLWGVNTNCSAPRSRLTNVSKFIDLRFLQKKAHNCSGSLW